ncbi:uncharacterized protein [Bemisia tabaci]|uniref:uncharacterized protein isoform X2 n=1 Tax=Bemisia tabaci TaxID=7038 RepID=UPI0008F9C5C3|nr:PREDICTED: zinc finger CCCH domain-containing protein 13-like isoform X2 [Bemisia tabaci]
MSKQSKLKASSEVTNGNSKDSRRPSVFDRLGSRFNSSTEGICKAWVQNGTCPYEKSCKYSNSHIVLSSLKRSSRKDIDYQLRVYKGERKGKSPDDGLDKWDSTDLEGADEKVLEKRLMLLQKELQKQERKGDEDHHGAYSSSKHSKLSSGIKKCSKRVGRSTSSDSSDSSSSVSSSSSGESSSSSSSDSGRRKHNRVPGKTKRRSASSYSDEHVSKKIKYSKSIKGKSPVMNRHLSRSRSPVGKHSPRASKHLAIDHRDKHRSVSPLSRQREREYEKPRERVRSKSPKSKGRTITPCRRSEHQKIIKRKESPEKLRNSRLTPEKHIITRKVSPPRNRQNDIRNDEKRRDEKLRNMKDDHRRVAPRIALDKRGEDERLRERRVREAARERERREALERCQERQRQRELAKVKAEREKEKARELERGKERLREPERRTVIKDRVRLPERDEKTPRGRERSFERTVSAKIKLNDNYPREERSRTITKTRDRDRSYERDQLSVDKERVMLKDRNLERILVHDAVKSLERRSSHERSIVRERVLDRERDLSRSREIEARRVLAAEDKGYDSPFRVRDERTARYLNEADDRSHFKDSPLREETRQIRIHPEDRRREVVPGRNSWEDKRPPHDWEAHRDWDPRLRRSDLHQGNDNWDRRRKGNNEDWGRYSKDWSDREWRKDWTPRNVQGPPPTVAREEPVVKKEEEKNSDSKKKTDVGGPLEEELSDISDEADDILSREDGGGDRTKSQVLPKKSLDMTAKEAIEDDIRKITQKKMTLNKMLSPGSGTLQDTLEDSLKNEPKDGMEQLDFEEISDEELEDEARARMTLGDALGVDWASLIAETRPKARSDADATPGSAKKQWESACLLEKLGVSVKYAGAETIQRLLNKYNSPTCKVGDKDIKNSDEFRTKDGSSEAVKVKIEDDIANSEGEAVKISETETSAKLNSNPISFLHPIAGIHVALRERQLRRRTLFNSINRALSARSDIALRRQLCGLPIRTIEVQQTPGFYQWVV